MDFVVDGIGYHVVTDNTGWRTITRLDGLPMTEVDFRRAGMSPASFQQPVASPFSAGFSAGANIAQNALAVIPKPVPARTAATSISPSAWLMIGAVLLLVVVKR